MKPYDKRVHEKKARSFARIPKLSEHLVCAAHAMRGLAQTGLAHVFTAAALNLLRLDAFLDGKKAAKTRVSRFAALAPASLAG